MGHVHDIIDGLVQERRNSSALAVELRLSSSNPSIWFLSVNNDWFEYMEVLSNIKMCWTVVKPFCYRNYIETLKFTPKRNKI